MNDPEAVKEFLAESHENLERLDGHLLELERNPNDGERLADVFRTLHTIKGTCGFLAFAKLERVAHAGESLLSRARDRKLTLTPAVIGALLALVDAVRGMLSSVEGGGTDGGGDYTALIAKLRSLAEGEEAPVAPSSPSSEAGDPATPASPTLGRAPDGLVRVDVRLLDKLMNLVSELVLARNQVLQISLAHADPLLGGASQRLDLITSQLQEGLLRTRMQPIRNLWNALPRVVHDLAGALGKQVRVEMVGEETELDRAVLEAISGPLVHLVRNAVAHGIETAAARLAKGKPAEGRVVLRASSAGGRVSVEVADDGAGLDFSRIKQRALESGRLSLKDADGVSDETLTELVFAPGFSTAADVTNVSGRGVGMDVVRTNVERVGGKVAIRSTLGTGTAFDISLPMTLAILPALLIAQGGQRFVVPQANLIEVVRVEGEKVAALIERIHGAPVYRLRGRLLPLVYLDRELALDVEPQEGEQTIHILVLEADHEQFGLVVSEVQETAEVVVKPLGNHLRNVPCFAGATILGDGAVALVVDVPSLARRAHVLGDSSATAARLASPATPNVEVAENQALLLVAARDDGRMAIPLGAVARLEEFPSGAVERVGGDEVVQYRGDILPLVRLSNALLERRSGPRGESSVETRATRPAEDRIHVVVYTDETTRAGIVVDRILDIVADELATKRPATRPGVLFSVVIRERVTEVLDVATILQRARSASVRPAAP